jgi:fermentation-respiration switch protein FrsA (DUF1100 family)
MKGIEFYPSSFNIPFEDVYIKTRDGLTINGWFIPHSNARYTLLFCHGNAGNISHRMEKLQLLSNIGINIFIIDYRSYGKSEGRPSEKGFYLDADAAYRYLVNKRRITPQQIILYGESLGGAVAIDLAAKAKVKAIIIEGGFSDEGDMARTIYPFMPTFVLSNKFDSLGKIKKVKAAKLFIHSLDDEIVPFELGYRLYRAAGEPKEFVKIRGGHNNAFLNSEEKYISSISSFLLTLTTPQ